MPVKRKYLRGQVQQLEQEALKQAIADGRERVKPLKAFITKQFERTWKFWNDSGANKFPVPKVIFKEQIVQSRRGVRILLNALVVDGSGKAHTLWHWLAMGTDDYTTQKTIRFRVRKAVRTFVRDLDARPFPGWDGWVSLAAGRTRKGIKGREWYEAIQDEVEAKGIKILNEGKTLYVVEDVEVKRP